MTSESSSQPWKSQLRKIPPAIRDKVVDLPTDLCVVACSSKISRKAIQDGQYNHIGLIWHETKPIFPSKVVPNPRNGSHSYANVEGKELVHRDRPMVSKTYSLITPNFGDWSKGTHNIDWTRQVFQREYIPPRELAIAISLLAEDIAEESYVFSFTVDEVLNRTDVNFDRQLLFNLNLLRENVGNHGVFPSKTTHEDFIRTLYVNWEILPPGERDNNIAKIFRAFNSDDPRIRQRIQDRYDTLTRLKPLQFIQGTSEFRHYFGALFADDLVVFENIEYGNAIYVLFALWREMSRKSRTELLARNPDEFIRIPHTKTWKLRLRSTILRELMKRQRT